MFLISPKPQSKSGKLPNFFATKSPFCVISYALLRLFAGYYDFRMRIFWLLMGCFFFIIFSPPQKRKVLPLFAGLTAVKLDKWWQKRRFFANFFQVDSNLLKMKFSSNPNLWRPRRENSKNSSRMLSESRFGSRFRGRVSKIKFSSCRTMLSVSFPKPFWHR